MARARNIKPGFYKNEDLAECSIWARFIFPGLWMMADREGRLEYRPKRIKGELLPYDNQDTEPLLRELERHGFILIYEVDGKEYIQIVKFSLHQNPHHREAESVIPPPKSLGLDGVGNNGKPEATAQCNDSEAQGKPRNDDRESDLPRGSSRADSLIPDSGFSDSPIREAQQHNYRGQSRAADGPNDRAIAVAVLLRKAGVSPMTGQHPAAREFADTGANDAQLLAAVDIARQRKPAPEAISPNYLRPILAEILSPKPRATSRADARAQERADVIATLTGRKPAHERTPDTLDVVARRVD